MRAPSDLGVLIPVSRMAGEDLEETGLLRQMLRDATVYIKSFKWCPSIRRRYFGCGIGGVVAVFLFQFREKVKGTDELLWVVEGDIPSAYLVVDNANDAPAALTVYCSLMEDWANAVLASGPMESVFPVNAKATVGNAKDLLKRVAFIRRRVLPQWQRKKR